MAQNQDKVLVIFPKHDPKDGSHLPYWYQVFSQAGKTLSLAVLFESGTRSVSIQHLEMIYIQRFLQKPINLLERFAIMVKWMLAGYRQVYIHYSLYSFVLAWILRPIFKLKINLWDCELYRELPKNKLLVWAIKQTDVLVTGSPSIATAYRKVFNLGNKPIKVVPNYVEKIKAPKIKLDQTQKHILFVHHLSPRKGSRQLPEIIKQSLDLRKDLIFHIVGSGPDKEWLLEQTSKYKDRVIFYGQTDRNHVAGLMQACDLFIMPSRSEGFPRVILEAMQYGLPFVSFDVGNVRELAGELQSRFIVKTNKVDQFVTACTNLLNYKQLNKLVSQNYDRACEYNLEQSRREFVKVFITSPKTSSLIGEGTRK